MKKIIKYILPQISFSDSLFVGKLSLISSIMAGLYGVVHDQITYSISREYFTKFKFDQFKYADFGLHERVFVIEIGFLATWWVGFFCIWFLARLLLKRYSREQIIEKLRIWFFIILTCAFISSLTGYFYALWHGPNSDYSFWEPLLNSLGVKNKLAFIKVAYIHNCGYAGALIGFLFGIIKIISNRSSQH